MPPKTLTATVASERTRLAWIHDDPEVGAHLVERPRAHARRSSFYRRCPVPVSLIERHARAAAEYGAVQAALAAIFDAHDTPPEPTPVRAARRAVRGPA